jgi:hypothetical protein
MALAGPDPAVDQNETLFAAVHESGYGTELTPPRRRRMSAFKGEAVILLDQLLVSNWTLSRH